MVTPRTSRTTTDTASDTRPLLDMARPPWWNDSLCLEPSVIDEVGSDFIDAEVNKTRKAAAMNACGRCLVMVECREYAIADPMLVGIWGGTDTPARKAIRRNREASAFSTGATARTPESTALPPPIGGGG